MHIHISKEMEKKLNYQFKSQECKKNRTKQNTYNERKIKEAEICVQLRLGSNQKPACKRNTVCIKLLNDVAHSCWDEGSMMPERAKEPSSPRFFLESGMFME